MKQDKKETLGIIAYYQDVFDTAAAFSSRYRYYHPEAVLPSIPRTIFDGDTASLEISGGLPSGSLYSRFVPLYDKAASSSPAVDISLSVQSADVVRVEVTNISGQLLNGTLQIVLVERHRPYPALGINVVDNVCRTMLPGINGQALNLDPGATAVSTQQFTVQADWNYCAIIAFFQGSDKRIRQGSMIELENTIPRLRISSGPATGAMWLRGSTHSIAWSSDRPLGSVQLEYSVNGGQDWTPIQVAQPGTGQYSWKLPEVSSTQCLLAVLDPVGGARAVSGPFAIGIKGDLNADGLVNDADRRILIDCLLENKATLVPGSDLNEDGVTDMLDLVALDAILKG